MLACFAPRAGADATPVRLIAAADYVAWRDGTSEATRAWLEATGFRPKRHRLALLPDGEGGIAEAIFLIDGPGGAADAAAMAATLPARERPWRIDDPEGLLAPFDLHHGWALAGYRFDRYVSAEAGNGGNGTARLATNDTATAERASQLALSVFLARDLVNTPANDLGPAELETAIREVAREFGATCTSIAGDELLAANYPMIHAVGRASSRPPRLVDLIWGSLDAPKLTLVGKGVCFDSGGLDIKPAAGMRLMKKDMGGAAVMTGLARMIMAAGLDVRLRLLVPAVENSIGASAFRPGDVLSTRKGLTVEVGNTDAEGRLILADALAEADREQPALLLDAATLTGAARVAVGTDLPALFTPDERLAAELLQAGIDVAEPLWRLPLHPGYRDLLKSPVADLSSTGSKPYAGAITAALFLQRFVEPTTSWAHLDIFAWNEDARPGRTKGGDATALRALFTLIERRYQKS
ncbi:MAG: leucyl aminopeptidase family protein [Geminicoccaceae bacterium]|nr:leucyl aminopeptidase family protein [Geminicoccaceae bacterium]HRY25325.1 leucyl aminopeptidase family protein [Geminicoccaceae bacterium]